MVCAEGMRHRVPGWQGRAQSRMLVTAPWYERSSELQPWIISSRSKSLSIFFSFFFFSPHHLYRTSHQVLATISTLAVEKAKRWNTVVVCLCLTEESLQNWAQKLTLKEELMWAVRQTESRGGRLWKGFWVGVSLSNCKLAHSVWTLIMHLSKHGRLWFCSAVVRLFAEDSVYIQTGPLQIQTESTIAAITLRYRCSVAGEATEWKGLSQASLIIIASRLGFIFSPIFEQKIADIYTLCSLRFQLWELNSLFIICSIYFLQL